MAGRRPHGWHKYAKCLSFKLLHPGARDIFFPQHGEKTNFGKQFCKNGCPVINDCLLYALYYEETGIWGGTDDRERRKIRPLLQRTLAEWAAKQGITVSSENQQHPVELQAESGAA